jgi:hypothetical protein
MTELEKFEAYILKDLALFMEIFSHVHYNGLDFEQLVAEFADGIQMTEDNEECLEYTLENLAKEDAENVKQ